MLNKLLTAAFTLLISMSAAYAANEDAVKAGNTVVLQSGEAQTKLLELYSSQGCSSCPPAEKWLNTFEGNSELWTSVVPVAFHVDYWDYIGWKDPFASSDYSNRQRRFRQQGLTRSVYTPGFLVNGSEWRGWFRRQSNLPAGDAHAGVLKAEITEGRITAEFPSDDPRLLLHVAVLGNGLTTHVQRGENKRRTLEEDFVVLHHQVIPVSIDNPGTWAFDWKKPLKSKSQKAEKFAAAIWVTGRDTLVPLQAAGGWLPKDYIL
jgi:hypothetical protein